MFWRQQNSYVFCSSRKAKLFSFSLLGRFRPVLSLVSHACFIPLVSRGKAVLDIPSVYSSLLNTIVLLFFRAIAVIDISFPHPMLRQIKVFCL